MEIEINPEYQKILVKLENVLKHASIGAYGRDIKEAIEAIRALGARPALNSNVNHFRNITTTMTKTYMAKNQDYGGSFDKSLHEFGLIASAVRINDKVNRIKTLVNNNPKVKDESIKDSLLDLANYAIMTIMWLDNNSTKEVK